jgi:hypothetical protein
MARPITRVFSALHGYIYGRWTARYLSLLRDEIISRLKPQGKRRLADGFHSKVITSEEARAIIIVDQPIFRRDLEQIIPYAAARTLILKSPPDIIVHMFGLKSALEQCSHAVVSFVHLLGVRDRKAHHCV